MAIRSKTRHATSQAKCARSGRALRTPGRLFPPDLSFTTPNESKTMPMNRLLFDHQVAKLRADLSAIADNEDQGAARRDLMNRTAQRITDWRAKRGLPNIGWPTSDRPDDQEVSSR